MTNGGRYWRFKYRFCAKEKVLALGVYPDVPLARARTRQSGPDGYSRTGGTVCRWTSLTLLADNVSRAIGRPRRNTVRIVS